MKDSVFLSYSHASPDAQIVRGVLLPILVELNLDVLIDTQRLHAGVDVYTKVGQLIRDSRALVLAASSASLASEFCEAECIHALTIRPQIPVVPLLIENVSWHKAPFQINRLIYTTLYNRPPADWLGIVADALQRVGVRLDRSNVGPPAPDLDLFSSIIHPTYDQLSVLDPSSVQALVGECRRRLSMRAASGHHNINLALLLLHLGEIEAACRHADLAIAEMSEDGETRYLSALVAASLEPLVRARRTRVAAIEALLINASPLGFESGLPHLLLAVIAREFYARNGMSSPHGDLHYHLANARARPFQQGELRRLLDTLRRTQPSFDPAQYGMP